MKGRLMTIPTFQELLLPILKMLAKGDECSKHSLIEELSKYFNLTDAEQKQEVPTGGQTTIANRYGWASTDLYKALLVDRSQPGYLTITERGKELLNEQPTGLTRNDLRRYDEFRQWQDKEVDPDPEGIEASNRSEPSIVRARIEAYLPEAVQRRKCLERLAESLWIANSISANSWTTSFNDVCRLNVGQLQTLLIKPGQIDLVVDKVSMTEDMWRTAIETEGVKIGGGGLPFKTIDTAYRFEIQVSAIDAALPLLAAAHLSLLEKAAQGRPSSSWKRGHWPSIPQYLREELNSDIPDPAWFTASESGVWLFQANPNVYPLADELKSVHPGDIGEWSVTAYRNRIKDGDTVLLWMAGPDAGVYATGEIIGEPFQRPVSGLARAKGDEDGLEWAIKFSYSHILD